MVGLPPIARSGPEWNAYQREWRAANHEEWNRKKRERKRARGGDRAGVHARRSWEQQGDLTTQQWLEILAAHEGRCHYCGEVAELEMEHMTPRTRGGQHTQSNIVAACGTCNRRKGKHTAEEFREMMTAW